MAPTPHDQDPGGRDGRQPPFPAPNPHDDLGAYPGLPQAQAEQRAYDRGWQTVRSLPPDAVVTMEYMAGRLNFTVADGRVQRCWMG
ncbi:I78 family peptidase inhibitor [Actinacidiphila bryophytorum]|uniref:I78 family peptidase inhibitor n=1 Tax=Actinacidiphila bryophytorum TaxID=1436133 RepID=UPI002176EA5D|nr:I78 family peptidase inhibitor [Actinacidiphila bryophytorum]UWE09149.1 I78 family peptidase inhibitor [Actinacidiphila bryophytorum]